MVRVRGGVFPKSIVLDSPQPLLEASKHAGRGDLSREEGSQLQPQMHIHKHKWPREWRGEPRNNGRGLLIGQPED